MERFFFEDVWKLLTGWGVLQFFLICLWSWTRSHRVAIANWMLPAMVAVLSAVSVAVVTPAEQIIETCRRLSHAVDDGDMRAIATHVSPDFEAHNLDRDRFLEKTKRALTRVRIDHLRLRAFEISVSSPTLATAVFCASCRIRTPEFTRSAVPSKWRIDFHREQDVWRITRIRSLPVPPISFRALGEWLR